MDLTSQHTKKVNAAVDQLASEGLIDDKTARALHAKDPRTPKFYMLPKVHKPNHQGRPIIAAVNSPTTNLARYVDHHLQPLAEKLPSYVKDTGDFLRKIERTRKVRPNSILVTMDVASLFTNIPHKEGVNAVAHALEQRKNPSIVTRVILKLLTLVLFLNNFCFDDKQYLQMKGCAMGAKCSGSYADLFMGRFEGLHIYPRINHKHHLYTRYKDDIFLIWTDGESSLKKFFSEINAIHPSIKFECHHSRERVSFLDTYVHLDESGYLSTSLFTKPTDRNAFLHHDSYHPLNNWKTYLTDNSFARRRSVLDLKTPVEPWMRLNANSEKGASPTSSPKHNDYGPTPPHAWTSSRTRKKNQTAEPPLPRHTTTTTPLSKELSTPTGICSRLTGSQRPR
jgi:hypothetical protein